ncbi:hypothetical protein M758_UG304800 [Ceratodon purpureus]|nr:hypothetical protein M758_UG304800 [Ceratodon purpureus]
MCDREQGKRTKCVQQRRNDFVTLYIQRCLFPSEVILPTGSARGALLRGSPVPTNTMTCAPLGHTTNNMSAGNGVGNLVDHAGNDRMWSASGVSEEACADFPESPLPDEGGRSGEERQSSLGGHVLCTTISAEAAANFISGIEAAFGLPEGGNALWSLKQPSETVMPSNVDFIVLK